MDGYCREYNVYPTASTQSNAYYSSKGGNCNQLSQQPCFTTQTQPENVSSASPGNSSHTATNSMPKFGKVILNRAFVGGIDFKTTEADLSRFFSTFGRVLHTKIIRDRAEISKGFGFVTFETEEEANKVRNRDDLYLNGKKLNMGPAIEKLQTKFPKDIHIPGPPGSWIMHPGGYTSYTHKNGITYFPPALSMVPTMQAPQQVLHRVPTPLFSNDAMFYPPSFSNMPRYASCTYAAYTNLTYGSTPVRYRTSMNGGYEQLITPSATQEEIDGMGMCSMTSSRSASNYLTSCPMPYYVQPGSYRQPLFPRQLEAPTIRHTAGSIGQVNSMQTEQARMVVAPAFRFFSSAHQQLLPSPSGYYTHQPPIRGFEDLNVHYANVSTGLLNSNNSILTSSQAAASENEILTPPLTPDKQKK